MNETGLALKQIKHMFSDSGFKLTAASLNLNALIMLQTSEQGRKDREKEWTRKSCQGLRLEIVTPLWGRLPGCWSVLGRAGKKFSQNWYGLKLS